MINQTKRCIPNFLLADTSLILLRNVIIYMYLQSGDVPVLRCFSDA